MANTTAGTAAITSVAASATHVSLLIANTRRLGAIIVNDSTTGTLYFAFGATATTSAYTDKLAPGQTWYMDTTLVYTGLLDGIWDIASGNARITELS